MDEMRFEEVMTAYYKRYFPFKLMHKWLSYGGSDKHYFCNREFSFTLRGDIYVRYQSFSDAKDFEDTIIQRCPEKIDIGAVFTTKPKDHKTVMKAAFQPLEKELVFDIDMTDYDDVRFCCTGTDVCSKCWTVMRIAVKVMDAILREDFGFRHLLWVFSGRRGVHCWVGDAAARRLTVTERETIVDYAELRDRGGSERGRIALRAESISKDYPAVARAIRICRAAFENFANDQDCLADGERAARFTARFAGARRSDIEKVFETAADAGSTRERLEALETYVDETIGNSLPSFRAAARGDGASAPKQARTSRGARLQPNRANAKLFVRFWDELILDTLYPRLDANVSRQLNHLLKAPFCVHPKTGRVCVPFDPLTVDSFDPHRDVPTAMQLLTELRELDAAARAKSQNEDQTTPSQATVASTNDSAGESDEEREEKDVRRIRMSQKQLFKKSAMREAIRLFEDFVNAVIAEDARPQARVENERSIEF